VTEPFTAESLAYWHREVTDRHKVDWPWPDEDVMVLVARFLATLADRVAPTPDTPTPDVVALNVTICEGCSGTCCTGVGSDPCTCDD